MASIIPRPAPLGVCRQSASSRVHGALLPHQPRGGPGPRWNSAPARATAARSSPSAAAPSVATVTEAPATAGVSPPATAAGERTAAPEQQLQPSQPYVWQRNWVPVSPVSFLDPSRPSPVMLLGQPLVVWRHAARGWVVMRDMCPHRLAPLSEGRMEAGGTRIACSYHGWEFNEGGACTKVPQLINDPRAAATACTSKRSCVTTFPTLEHGDMLFAWLDASEEGLAALATAAEPRILGPEVAPLLDWVMTEVPADYQYIVEQGMDPSHANFLHHGASSFRMENYVPFGGRLTRAVDLRGGFRWAHGAYEKQQGDSVAFRDFQPPFNTWVMYPSPSGDIHYITLVVPVRPGVCRAFQRSYLGGAVHGQDPPRGQLLPADAGQQPTVPQRLDMVSEAASAAARPAPGTDGTNGSGSAAAPQQSPSQATSGSVRPHTDPNGKRTGEDDVSSAARTHINTGTGTGTRKGPAPSWLFRLFGALPHWVYSSGLIGDQDLAVLSKLGPLMWRNGLTARDYYLNSKADMGVAAMGSWLRQAGYPESLWGRQPAVQTGPTYSSWPSQELSLEQILSRQERHVRHCAVCQRGMKLVTAVCTALTAAAGLAAVATVALAVVAATRPEGVAAVGGWGPLAGALAACLGLVAAAVQGWSFREERFVSGAPQWRRKGGFAGLGRKS